ncbi:MAG: hypothetical protein IT269_12725 [Saprospiraceae bacterium]|nr:hypothetical protein [Saprospiraceae bacterium]
MEGEIIDFLAATRTAASAAGKRAKPIQCVFHVVKKLKGEEFGSASNLKDEQGK